MSLVLFHSRSYFFFTMCALVAADVHSNLALFLFPKLDFQRCLRVCDGVLLFIIHRYTESCITFD